MMQDWFPDAKLGIFIHYGIYAVRSVSESRSFFNGTISYDEYMQQLEGITAVSDLSVVKRTPAGRDIVREYTGGLKDSGIRTGLYFLLIDWSGKQYPTLYAEGSVPGDYIHDKPFSSPVDGRERYDLWERFLEFNRMQIAELMSTYGTVDLLWFDGDWERSARQWRMAEFRDFLHDTERLVGIQCQRRGL